MAQYTSTAVGAEDINRIIKKTDWTSDMEPYHQKAGLDL
jgi:hypothetical protein